MPDDFFKNRGLSHVFTPHAMVAPGGPTSGGHALGSAPYSSVADDPNSDVALVNLAENLGNDPVRIYEWVRNNVRTEFYFGCQRGAYLTFLERAGNDVDQCALLGALFKAAGYTPEYRDSVMWVPLTASGANTVGAYQWLGVDDAASAVNVLANFSASIDTSGSVTNGMLRFNAMWVAIDLPGGRARFFPFVKPYNMGRKPDLDALSGYTFTSAASAAGATTAGSPTPAINSPGLRSYLAGLTTQAAAAIHGSLTYHDLSGAELARIPTIVPEIVTVTAPGKLRYPSGFYYNDDSLTTPLAGIPTSMTEHMTLTVGNYSRTFECPELLGKPLDVEFDGAGDAIVRLQGTELGRDTSGSGSQSVTITESYELPSAYYGGQSPAPYTYSINVIRQNAVAVVYGFGTVAPRLEKTLRDISEKEVANSANVTLTDRLEIVGQQYISQCDEFMKIGSNFFDHRHDRFANMGYVYLRNGNPVVDMGINVVDLYARSASAPPTAAVRSATSLALGALEGTAIQQMSGARAFGTPTLFDQAMTMGRSSYLITSSSELSQVQGSLQNFNDTTLGAGSMTAIQNQLNAGGHVVVLGDSSVSYGGTTFGGYFEIAPDGGVGTIITGAAGGVTNAPVGSNSIAEPTTASPTTATNTNPNVGSATSSDPVDLTTGGFIRTERDLALGRSAPNGLELNRTYNSATRLTDPVGLGRGWTHNYAMRVLTRSPNDLDTFRASVDEVLPALLAFRLAEDAVASEASARAWMLASSGIVWAVDQQINSRASVALGARSMEFVAAPDGSYAPPPGVTSVLSKAADGSYTLSARNGNTVHFRASDGKFTSVVDLFGNTLTASYDASSHLQTVTDAYNRTLTFLYDGSGRLYEVDDSTGRKVLYGRDGSGNFTFTDADNNVETYVWDADYLLTRIVDARNRTVVENDYDFWKRVWQQRTFGDAARTTKILLGPGVAAEVDPAGNAVWSYFDGRGRRTNQVDALHNMGVWQYDGADRLVKRITPTGATTLYGYDQYDVLTSETVLVDASTGATNTRTVVPDSSHRPWQVSNFEGKVTVFTYATGDLIDTITAPGNIVTSFTYDSRGRVHTEHPATYAAAAVKTYAYDAYGNISSITYPDSTVDSYIYSVAGDPTQIVDRNGAKVTFGYNNRRIKTSVTQWMGTTQFATQLNYDATDQLAYVIDASGRRVDYDYDAMGNLLSVKQGPLGAQTTVVSNTYDPNRLLLWKSTNALNNTAVFSYDANQRMSDAYDPLNHHTQQTYDADGRPLTQVSPLGFKTMTTYTLDGFKNSETDAEGFDAQGNVISGHTVDYVYDKDGRITTLANRFNKAFTWTYDDDNRSITTKTPLGRTIVAVLNTRGLPASIAKPTDAPGAPSITFDSYDAEGRLTQKTDGVGASTYTYWPNGLMKQVTDAGHTTYRGYDQLNRLIEYHDGEGNILHYDYLPSGELKQITYPDGKLVTYDYDTFGRMWHVTDWNSRVTTYSYDAASHITRIDRPNGTYRIQQYDANSALTRIEDHKSDGSIFYYEDVQYDADGRLVTQSQFPKTSNFPVPVDTLSYNDDNGLLTWNAQAVSVDANGNMTSGPLPSGAFGIYNFDARNRVISAGGCNYRYNPDGTRVEITGTGAAAWVIDPNAGLSRALVRTKGGVTTYYVYGLGLLYEETAGSAKQYHFDHRGDTVALTDSTQTVTDRWTYLSYGTVASRTGTTDTPFQFNGMFGVQTDPNGLLYMRSRYYNPRLMRFVNADPTQFDGGQNWFAYCGNNPMTFVDPLGLDQQATSTDESSSSTGKPRYIGEVIIYINRRPDPQVDPHYARNKGEAAVSGLASIRETFEQFVRGSQEITESNTYWGAEQATILAAQIAGGAKLARYAPDPIFGVGGWKGKNGLWYPETWGGNGTTGGRLKFAAETSEVAGRIGRRLFWVGTAFSIYDAYAGARAHNGWKVAQATADIGAGVFGEFGGPIGWAFAGGYFIGRALDEGLGLSDGIARLITGYP